MDRSDSLSWEGTVKSVDQSNIFRQLPYIWKRFRVQIIASIVAIVGFSSPTSGCSADLDRPE